MARKDLKTRTAIYTAIDNNIHQKLSKYAKENNMRISKILDAALEAYLKEKGVDMNE